MTLSPKLTYDDFCLAADKLYYEHMEMPTAVKTHHLIGHGSLATHQHYLVRWKESRKRKPTTLPEQLSLKIHEKSQSYAEELWKSLSKSQQEIQNEIKITAKASIEKAQAEANEAQKARETAEQALNTLQSQWQGLSHDHNIATTQLVETQKQLFMSEEACKSLEKQLNEVKENTAQQLTYLRDQDEKNRVLFKEQQRYQILKNESFHEKVALQQAFEKLSQQQKSLESQLHQKQMEAEQGRVEVRKLEAALDESKNQQTALQQENRELIVQIRDKNNQILQGQSDVNSLQEKLQNLQLKIDNLQEEKLTLIQEKFQLEKDFQKKPKNNFSK